ncbi:MAG: hypothetical protein Q7J72_02515 [Candidatus Omnitrophota bacterium]|nr:hypothetical protein [Candidatus Omnitrophota bacterium]
MLPKLKKLTSILLCFLLILQQTGFSQTIDLSGYFNQLNRPLSSDKFRPLHLRCISYDIQENSFRLRLDKGSLNNPSLEELEGSSKTLFNYFLIGLSLPNDSFWVNLRPDSPDNIIDDSLAQTDMGKVMLETDLQLKKDTAQSTSPNTPEGKAYWDKIYQKAEELYGTTNITIPTLTRPWIIPGEIIIGETQDSAYIYKATLKVMLEEDYLTSRGGSRTAPTPDQYTFSDPRLKELNEYSTRLIKELIIPKLTYEVNTSKRYAPLRQVYYSLILAQWFKARFSSHSPQFTADSSYIKLIDSRNLSHLSSKEVWNKLTYFKQYQESFAQGEYNLKEPRSTPSGQTVRSYFSGGEELNIQIPPAGTSRAGSSITIIPSNILLSSPTETEWINTEIPEAASSLIDINLSPVETANELAKELKLLPPDNLILSFTISGKDFKVWSNTDRTLYIIGPLILLPLLNTRLDKPIERLKEELAVKEKGGDLDSIVQKRISRLHGIPGESFLKENPNVLLVPPFSAVPAQPINPYSALMISKMLTTNFKGTTVIDAGSGAGLLSLVALRLGAKKVILIESNKTERGLAKVILKTQGYEEGNDFVTLNADLNDTKKLKKELEDLGISQEIIIVVANIGPWYGKANRKAIELFIKLGVGRIINGGYSFNFPAHKENLVHIKALKEIFDLLRNPEFLYPEIKVRYKVEEYPPFNDKLPIPTGYGLISATLETTQPLTDENQNQPAKPTDKKSSSAVTFGGIDFRSLPIVTQARNNLSADMTGPAMARLKDTDLNQEWRDIQNITRSGITPSPERIKEYLQGVCLKDAYSREKAENIILCLSDILRLEEENYLATDSLLKDILIVLSSTNTASELKEAFLGSTVK